MDNKKRLALSSYRMEQSEETLKAAKMCLDNRFYKDCINRSYYVAFYAVKLRDTKMPLRILIKHMWHQENCQERLEKDWAESKR